MGRSFSSDIKTDSPHSSLRARLEGRGLPRHLCARLFATGQAFVYVVIPRSTTTRNLLFAFLPAQPALDCGALFASRMFLRDGPRLPAVAGRLVFPQTPRRRAANPAPSLAHGAETRSQRDAAHRVLMQRRVDFLGPAHLLSTLSDKYSNTPVNSSSKLLQYALEGSNMAKTKIHIYPLSRLVFAPAVDWLRILEELEGGRKQMFWSYKPLRQGAYRLLKAKEPQRENIYEEVEQLAQRAGGGKCAKANVRGLRVFEKEFMPSIAGAKTNLMEQDARGVEFGGVVLVGGPHFSVLDKSGGTRFIYLHPSAWEDDESEAFCELLTVIIEKRFEAEASNLWFLDLRKGTRLAWPKSKLRLRRKCEQAANLLTLLRAANFEETPE